MNTMLLSIFKKDFWRIQMHQDDNKKIAFVKIYSVYKWKFMPFGRCSVPATFQIFTEEVLDWCRLFFASFLNNIAIWETLPKNFTVD